MTFRKSDSLRWYEVTAVFGGRFDPPHLGHREAVRGLFKNPAVKQVIILPSGNPPHKSAAENPLKRTEAARIGFSPGLGDPFPSEVIFDLREVERAQQYPLLPNYSFDTIRELTSIYSQLAFVVGADQLAGLSTWYRFPELLKQCHWIVLERKPTGSAVARETLREWEASGLITAKGSNCWKTSQAETLIQLVPTEAIEISSTTIRESIARTGAPPAGCLLPEVLDYLKAERLYGF